MGSSNESSVLAARVFSYLKRRAGKGKAPTSDETKAAVVALQLLNNRYPGIVADSSKAVDNLAKLARKDSEPPASSDFGDLTNPGNAAKFQAAMFSYQQTMQKLNEMFQLMSNVLKQGHDIQMTAIRNLRG